MSEETAKPQSSMKGFLIGMTGLLFGACAPQQQWLTKESLEQLHGQPPKNHTESINKWLNEKLRDPYSIRDLEIGAPMKENCTILHATLFNPLRAFYGWQVRVGYNAKNAYGAYVGRKTYYYWFVRDELKGVTESPYNCPEALAW